MRLSKDDFYKLDELLSKVGFGGYYDLIELLKMTVNNLEPKLDVHEETDLQTLVLLIYKLTSKERKE